MTRDPANLSAFYCKREPDCTLLQGGRCARAAEFADPLNECKSLHPFPLINTKSVDGSVVVVNALMFDSPADDIAPWRGRHLHVQEAEELVRRSPARVISVLGPYDAGKTSLIASFFLQVANGQNGALPYRFASSRTLYGFQDLVDRANRWSGQPDEQIVDHTPKDDGHQGGRFLHMGLRPINDKDDRHIDVLLSDVTGEWIQSWSERVDVEAKRRLAFIPRSDGFIVVADSALLMSNAGMEMDSNIDQLIRRIVSAAGPRKGRPLALIFSKFDRVIHEVDPPESHHHDRDAWGELGALTDALWGALDHAKKAGFEVGVFAVSAFPKALKQGQPAGVMAPFAHIMKFADAREPSPRVTIPVPEGADAFQSMRRWRDEP